VMMCVCACVLIYRATATKHRGSTSCYSEFDVLLLHGAAASVHRGDHGQSL